MELQHTEECQLYFERIAGKKGASSHEVNNAISLVASGRKHQFSGRNLMLAGNDIVATPELDNAVIKGYTQIPNRTIKHEKHFLIFETKDGYHPSKIFSMPENGDSISYACWLNQPINWKTVAAICHTHPYYGHRETDKINRFFSNGDPTGLKLKQVPVYMRTPKADSIKVMELRNNFVTSRVVTGTHQGKARQGKEMETSPLTIAIYFLAMLAISGCTNSEPKGEWISLTAKDCIDMKSNENHPLHDDPIAVNSCPTIIYEAHLKSKALKNQEAE